MAYNEEVAERIRAAFSKREELVEKAAVRRHRFSGPGRLRRRRATRGLDRTVREFCAYAAAEIRTSSDPPLARLGDTDG